MDKRLIAANALSFFSMVIVYQAFLTVASPLSAIRLPFSLMQLNLWFMFVSLLGVLLFLFIIWMFFNVALRSRRPELWAGMGRAIEMPFLLQMLRRAQP